MTPTASPIASPTASPTARGTARGIARGIARGSHSSGSLHIHSSGSLHIHSSGSLHIHSSGAHGRQPQHKACGTALSAAHWFAESIPSFTARSFTATNTVLPCSHRHRSSSRRRSRRRKVQVLRDIQINVQPRLGESPKPTPHRQACRPGRHPHAHLPGSPLCQTQSPPTVPPPAVALWVHAHPHLRLPQLWPPAPPLVPGAPALALQTIHRQRLRRR